MDNEGLNAMYDDADFPQWRRADHKTSRLLDRFPDVDPNLLKQFESDPGFCELCDQYEACNDALEHLKQSRNDRRLQREYSALRLQLEGELLRYILERSDGYES